LASTCRHDLALGLSTLEDQQLGGLIMWVPGGVLFTVYVVAAFDWWLQSLSREPKLSG
jgi:putative membrane protein